MTNLFGTDGIRGRVGVAPITADVFLHIGWAVGSVLAKKDKASVIIGKDTRASGYLFESALEAGFLSAGVDVGLLGPMPTPAIAYLTKEYSASTGVVISASHNHFQDNGVKFFSAEGFKFSDKEQAQIEEKLNMKANVTYKERAFRDVDVVLPSLENSKTKLGWEPTTDMDTGLNKTIEWYTKYENELTDIKFKYDYEK